MPLYEYDCSECGDRFEQRRSYEQADDLLPCPYCGSLLTERALSIPNFNRGAAQTAAVTTASAGTSKRAHRSGCPCCA